MAKNVTWRQHFVPQSYLKRFAYKSFKKGNKTTYCILVYDKNNGNKPRLESIKNIGYSKYFYDISKCENVSNIVENPVIIEQRDYVEKKLLDKIDDANAKLLDEIIQRIDDKILTYPENCFLIEEDIIDIKDKNDFSALICFQLMRTPKTRKHLLNGYKKIEESFPSNFKEELDFARKNLSFEHIYNFMFDEKFITEITYLLKDKIWLIGINKTEKAFFTSDHPVVHDDPNNFQGIKLMGNGLEILFPITPKIIFMILDKDSNFNLINWDKKGVFLDLERVQKINLLQIEQSDNQIYSSQKIFEQDIL